MKFLTITIAFLFFTVIVFGQTTLSVDEYLKIVRSFHPVAKQAGLEVEIANAGITSARGPFDPKYEGNFGRKEFGGLLYYNHHINELKIPTWYGLDFVAGIENLGGERTSTPGTKGQTSYLGFTVPLGKGLLMDERRAALQQARIFKDLSMQEQRKLVNNLLYDAASAYWNWWQSVQLLRLVEQAAQNAEERFVMVQKAFAIGERPAIDTVEAIAQLQGFRISAAELGMNATNARLELDVYLWTSEGQPYVLPPDVSPQAISELRIDGTELESLLARVSQHPEMQQYVFKIRSLEVDRLLKFQYLLPAVSLKYNQLNRSYDITKSFSSPWLQNNYRYGVAVALPLLLSQGRGDYRQARLKLHQARLQQSNKLLELQTKLRQYYNQWQQVQRQVLLQNEALASYTHLQRGEEIKFANGESSLFLVNSRQSKTLEARQKAVELQGKLQKAAISVLWAAGLLN